MQKKCNTAKFRAIVIVGDEVSSDEAPDRLFVETEPFIRYLKTHPRCKDFQIFRMKHRNGLKRFVDYFKQPISDSVLLLYHGHGSFGCCWNTAESDSFSYYYLLSCLRKVYGSLLIINDCCYAGALVSVVEHDQSLQCESIGVIAACPKDKSTISALQNKILAAWQKGKPYQVPKKAPRTIWQKLFSSANNEDEVSFRWGANLDHHFI